MMKDKKINLVGKISHFFTINQPLSFLLLVVFLVFGLSSFFLTSKQYNPLIIRPAFLVSLDYVGATTNMALNNVVYELMEKINTVPGVDEILTEVRDGAKINMTVIFDVGYDKTKAKVDLQSYLHGYNYLSQGNITFPNIKEINPETIPVLQIVFTATDLTVGDLREEVIDLSRQLQMVPGVSELAVFGGYNKDLVVAIDLQKLNANKITLESLTKKIQQNQNRQVLSGLQAEHNSIEFVFNGVIDSAEELGNLLVTDGVRLRDVASVYEGVANNNRSYVFYQDQTNRGEVVMLSVAKKEGESAPVVTKTFLSELDSLIKNDNDSNLSYKVVSNDGVTAQEEIFGLTENLITSIIIVSLILILFLSFRSALVVLITIPVTLLLVFGLGYLFGQTINRITLFALILSLGLLVDATIVAVENIHSYLRKYANRISEFSRARVIAGALDEIGVGLLLSTITSVIVFLPMNYITGMMGPYMGPIAFFVPMALIVSFLVAIIITPFVSNYILQVDEKENYITAKFSNLMKYLTGKYTVLLESILRNTNKQKIILQSALGLFTISLLLPIFGLVHFQMLPRADRDQFYLYLDLPVDTETEFTKEVTERISDVLLMNENVESVQEFIATPPILDFNGMFKGAGGRSGKEQSSIRVNLLSVKNRQISSNDIAMDVRRLINDNLPDVKSYVRIIEEPPGPPVMATLVMKLMSSDMEQRRQTVDEMQDFIGGIDGVVDTYSSEEELVGRVSYKFDYNQAGQLGITPESVLNITTLLSGNYIVSEWMNSDKKDYSSIVLTLPSLYLSSPETINNISVLNSAGESISLNSILKIDYELRQNTVYLENAQPLSYVTAEVNNRSIVYVVIEIIKRLVSGELPGYKVDNWNLWGLTLVNSDNQSIELSWGGEWKMTLENFRDLGIAMGVALLLVYMLLVAQYNNFKTPAYVLVTVPLGLVGILWGFLILDIFFGIYLTATALIGFIALIGIVVNNAIIYLEYVEQAIKSGLSYNEALLMAGQARLRPILLTSLTTVLGSLTIANDPVWSGLAWSIVFGLSLSTALTLLIYPTLLTYFKSDS